MIHRTLAAFLLCGTLCLCALNAAADGMVDEPDPSAPLGPGHVPFIQGSVTLKTKDRGQLNAGYVGLTTRDMLHSNLAGMALSAGDTNWWVQADTFKPRITRVGSAKKDDIYFRHIKLEPGQYLVYARWRERFLDWRWLEVKADAKLSVDFTLDPDKPGRLEVSLAKPIGSVQLIPLDAQGKLPLPAKFASRVAFALGTSIKTAGPSPVIDGLRPGRYRVLAGQASADVEVKSDETVSVSPK